MLKNINTFTELEHLPTAKPMYFVRNWSKYLRNVCSVLKLSLIKEGE